MALGEFLEPLHEPPTGPRPRVEDFQPPVEALARLRTRCLAVGGVAALVSLIGFFFAPRATFLRAYLVGWLYALGAAAGCLAILMLHHMSRGAWGLVVRRVLEAGTRTLPALALLFLPIVLGARHLYEWARPEAVASDPLLQSKQWYLNLPFFVARSALVLGLWALVAFTLSGMSRRQDETADPGLFRRMQNVAGPGIVLYVLTATLGAVDWLMSLDPRWFSSIFGLHFVISQGLTALAFMVLVEVWLARNSTMAVVLQPRHYHDHGKLILAFVMVWAYFSYSQFLIIWSGNLPEEVTFYHRRLHGGWQWLSLAVLLFHFVLPFVLLLSRDLKRSASLLTGTVLLVLGARFLDLYWQAAPSLRPEGLALHWLDLTLPLAIGGLWLAAFFRELARRPLLPVNDPWIVEAIEHE
jgi:hypothetical protein